jgi:hypothetical protein
LAAW